MRYLNQKIDTGGYNLLVTTFDNTRIRDSYNDSEGKCNSPHFLILRLLLFEAEQKQKRHETREDESQRSRNISNHCKDEASMFTCSG